MKNKILLVIFLMVMCLLGCCVGCCQGEELKALQIVTTNFPCYDAARAIAGDTANITMLLPPGSESHSYEPSPADIIQIQEADLFIYVGGESDHWVAGILESFGEQKPQCLTLVECVSLLQEERSGSMETEPSSGEEEAENDEHVWTSPINMMQILTKITERLCSLEPEKSYVFKENLDTQLSALQELDAAFRQAVEGGKRKLLVFGDRFPFLYFVREYGLSYDAAFPGCSEDSEPSARTVISLIDRVIEEKIPVVFYIEFSSRRTADMIAKETGARELLFHSCHNVSQEEIEAGATYLSLMWQNVAALKEALQ